MGADPAPAATAARAARFPGLQAVILGLESAQRANHTHMVPFTVTREYELFSGDDKEPKGAVIAEVHFQPPTTKTWEITKTSGNERAEKVVKGVLEREVKYANDGKIAIAREHYDFRYLGTGEADHRPSYILQLVPKHDDGNLLRGRIWVDRDTYLIHRFEGELAKSPSWWIKDLKLFTSYATSEASGCPPAARALPSAPDRLAHHDGTHTQLPRRTRRGRWTCGRDLTRLARARTSRPYRSSPAAALGVGIITGR